MNEEDLETMTSAMATVADMAVRGMLTLEQDGIDNAAGYFTSESVLVCCKFTAATQRAVIGYLTASVANATAEELHGLWWAWLVTGSSAFNADGMKVFDEKGAYVVMAMTSDGQDVGQFVYPIAPEYGHWHIVSPADDYNAANRDAIRILKGALRVAQTLQEDDDESGSTAAGDPSGV